MAAGSRPADSSVRSVSTAAAWPMMFSNMAEQALGGRQQRRQEAGEQAAAQQVAGVDKWQPVQEEQQHPHQEQAFGQPQEQADGPVQALQVQLVEHGGQQPLQDLDQ